MMAKILVKKLNPNAVLPTYANPGDAGCDVSACLDAPVVISPGQTKLIPTGLSFSIQGGFECQVRSRSGLSLKNGIVVLNSPGTIDSQYLGPVGVILYNVSQTDFTVTHGMRIAQLVFAPVSQASFQLTEDLGTTQRGSGGFGSSGV